MTTVWRPRVRIPVPDIDGADTDENRRDESTKKGTKRKNAPEALRAVRARGEVPLELQGVRVLVRTVVGALGARSAVGHVICEHGRERSDCKECLVGDQSASTVVGALGARSAVGHKYASTVVCAIDARSAVGREYASMVVGALIARSATRRNSSVIYI